MGGAALSRARVAAFPPSRVLPVTHTHATFVERDRRLREVADQLRADFVGIDPVIDELIDAVRVWYVMPEALTRPVIVNLWGMTGVGKTDLVRRMVKGLDYQDRFLEIELSNSDHSTRTVAAELQSNDLDDSDPKILLFDEVQRFRTLDTKGQPIDKTAYRDFWELLSDGRLARRDREDLQFMIAELLMKRRGKKKGDDEDDPIDLWDAQSIKRALGLREDLDQVASMGVERTVETLRDATQKKRVFEPDDHSKALILISGNLDEAYSMAGDTSEADVDADIFYAYTEKVTSVDVKQALTQRFTPEQVARFGNIHLVYRSLKRVHFEELIEREVARNVASARELLGLDLSVDASIHRLIYRNGVFPAQGVRPVFSTVADVLEANLLRFVLETLGAPPKTVALRYDEARHELVAVIDGDREIRRSYVGRLDKVRDDKVADYLLDVAAHESGHAVAYAALFGVAPLQLTARVASAFAAGFTFPHQIHQTRGSLLAQIQVCVAGGVAEELLFGAEHASAGRRADWERATELALDFVRRYGFDDAFRAAYVLDDEHKMDKFVTDAHVEATVARMVDQTRSLLREHRALLERLTEALVQCGRLEAAEVARICTECGLSVAVRPEGHLVIPSYRDALRGLRS